MGKKLYSRLLEEAGKLPKNADSIPQRPTGEVIDLKKSIKEAKKAAQPKEPNDFDLIPGTNKRFYEIVPCSRCGAGEGETCKRDERLLQMCVHHARLDAYAALKGLSGRSELRRMPWLRYPNADEYEKWGVFAAASGGLYRKTVVKTLAGRRPAIFSSHEHAQVEAEKQNAKKDLRPGGYRSIFPLVLHEGEWTREDLLAETRKAKEIREKGPEAKLSKNGKAELEHMRRQVRDNPDDEAEPTARLDNLPMWERDFIKEEYDRIGGK